MSVNLVLPRRHTPTLQPQCAPALAPRAAPADSAPLAGLRHAVLPLIEELLARMFGCADELLLDIGERSEDPDERRRCMGLMRTLRMEGPKLERAFARQAARLFDPLAPEPQGTIGPDEAAVLTNIATRAKQQHHERLGELQRAAEHAMSAFGVGLPLHLLTPARICDALRATLDLLDADSATRLLLFRLFEHGLSEGLAQVYDAALQEFSRHGLRPARAASKPAPEIDARTRDCLQDIAAHAAGADARLAGGLLDALQAGTTAAAAIAQRLELVTQLLAALQTDPHLPRSFQPLFEALRYSAVKSALADADFFARAGHPVRVLLSEAAQHAQCARLAGAPGVHRAEQLLGELPAQAGIAASFVIPALDGLRELEESVVASFLDSLREETAQRREVMLGRVRRMVAQELEVQTLGAQVPLQAQPLLRSGLGPLLAIRLMQYGLNSRLWNDAMDRLSQVVRSLDPVGTAAERQQMRDELTEALYADLVELGLAPARVRELLDGLRVAYGVADREARRSEENAQTAPLSPRELSVLTADFGAPAAAEPVQAPVPVRSTIESALALECRTSANDAPAGDVPVLMAALLRPQAWFRVHDAGAGATRWLKVAGYFPSHDSVAFTGFDSECNFRMRASRVLEDLVAARTEPIDPSPEMSQALARLRRQA